MRFCPAAHGCSRLAQTFNLNLLVGISLPLFFSLAFFLDNIAAVIAGIGFQGMRQRVDLQNTGRYLIQEGAIMRDQQNSVWVCCQPVLQPLKHLDVEMVGRLIQYQDVGFGEKCPAQRQAGLLTTAQMLDRCGGVKILETEAGEDFFLFYCAGGRGGDPFQCNAVG